MYNIINTEGLIIGSRNQGEANKIITIFTRELGLVNVIAQGIRLEKSKLRYQVSDHSFGRYSLIKGKEMWRLTDAVEMLVLYGNFLALIARLSLLLKKFIHGEEPHPELFDDILACVQFMTINDGQPGQLDKKRLEILESIIVLRILRSLGYVGDDRDIKSAIYSCPLSLEVLDGYYQDRKVINSHINKAIRESGL